MRFDLMVLYRCHRLLAARKVSTENTAVAAAGAGWTRAELRRGGAAVATRDDKDVSNKDDCPRVNGDLLLRYAKSHRTRSETTQTSRVRDLQPLYCVP